MVARIRAAIRDAHSIAKSKINFPNHPLILQSGRDCCEHKNVAEVKQTKQGWKKVQVYCLGDEVSSQGLQVWFAHLSKIADFGRLVRGATRMWEWLSRKPTPKFATFLVNHTGRKSHLIQVLQKKLSTVHMTKQINLKWVHKLTLSAYKSVPTPVQYTDKTRSVTLVSVDTVLYARTVGTQFFMANLAELSDFPGEGTDLYQLLHVCNIKLQANRRCAGTDLYLLGAPESL
ncbi:hypothetical protein BJ742DRAFT_745806 [Cladochytrium replicatum]|nr:hypothetical protein BJ742DRAFT_745806 [Cladochytrium replicatum]